MEFRVMLELSKSLSLESILTFVLISASIIGFVHARRRGESNRAAGWAGLETGLTSVLGAIAAGLFVWLMLALGGFSPKATFAVGWFFLLWPGVIDTIAWLLNGHTVFKPEHLTLMAGCVGTVVGFADGLRRIHAWSRWGSLQFLADVTWGLANNVNASLIHLINLGWGKPIPSQRVGAHRYDRGFCFAPHFALTQGNVCSNLRGRVETDLFDHEYVHVLQNRIFGPIFPLTYVGWMILFLIPAAIYGLVVGRLGSTIMSWCYFNNPWEEWAYRIGGGRYPELVWPIHRTLVWGVIFFAAVFGGLGWIIAQVWIP
jgi:hypothetical protein